MRNLRVLRATAPAAQVVKVHAPKPASGGRPAGKRTAERLPPPSSMLDRAAAKVQVAWRARADSKAQVPPRSYKNCLKAFIITPLVATHERRGRALTLILALA